MMKNPFGTNISLVTAAKAEKTGKEADIVKLELQCVPSLQSAKEMLIEVSENLVDGEMLNLVQGFVTQIEKMQEQVLALTMQSIRAAREVRKETVQEEPEAVPQVLVPEAAPVPAQ